MTIEFGSTILGTTQTAPEPEDYTGADGLLYCGKCKKRKKPISRPDKAVIFGRARHPAECDCQRKIREEREAARNAAATLTRWRT